MVRRFPVSRAKGQKAPTCVLSLKQSVPRGITSIAIAKINFLELEIALWVRVGRTKDFKPYAEDES